MGAVENATSGIGSILMPLTTLPCLGVTPEMHSDAEISYYSPFSCRDILWKKSWL
jgi:hypothetical protein